MTCKLFHHLTYFCIRGAQHIEVCLKAKIPCHPRAKDNCRATGYCKHSPAYTENCFEKADVIIFFVFVKRNKKVFATENQDISSVNCKNMSVGGWPKQGNRQGEKGKQQVKICMACQK